MGRICGKVTISINLSFLVMNEINDHLVFHIYFIYSRIIKKMAEAILFICFHIILWSYWQFPILWNERRRIISCSTCRNDIRLFKPDHFYFCLLEFFLFCLHEFFLQIGQVVLRYKYHVCILYVTVVSCQ